MAASPSSEEQEWMDAPMGALAPRPFVAGEAVWVRAIYVRRTRQTAGVPKNPHQVTVANCGVWAAVAEENIRR
jgi:hypothetical protein